MARVCRTRLLSRRGQDDRATAIRFWQGATQRDGRVAEDALLPLAVALCVISGCRPAGPLARAGIALEPSRVVAARRPTGEPGARRAAGGMGGAGRLVAGALPHSAGPGGSAAMIAEALANRLENLPELRLIVNRTETVGETTAARVEVVAPGNRRALAPSGTGTPIAPAGKTLIPTREVTLGFHRPDATLFLTWDSPESSYGRIAPEIQGHARIRPVHRQRKTVILRILIHRLPFD